MLRKTTFVGAAVVLAIMAGCQSHAQSKQAAKERWQKATSQIKLSLAKQQYENGKYSEARKNVTECISAEPQSAEAHLVYGKVLLAEGERVKAENELHTAVELKEELDEGWYWLGVAAQEARQTDLASRCYDKALSLNGMKPDYVLAVAEMLTASKNYDEAVRLLEEKMKEMPRNVSLKVSAGDLMSRVGRLERAIELYREALLMAGEDESISESLGYCYVFSDKWEEGAKIFTHLAEELEGLAASNPENEMSKEQQQKKRKVYLEMGALCSMKSGQYDRAVDCYSKLCVGDRDNAEVWVQMGRAALGAGMTQRALACGQRAYSLRPGYADATNLVGCSEYAEGRYAEAAASFEKLTTDKNNKGFAYLMCGRCYEQLGQKERAERAYKKALEINPESELGVFLAKNPGSQIK